MAKQGQHNKDARDPDRSPGHNNPAKSVEITTGSSKRKDTYRKQAIAHEDPGKVAQHDKNEWQPDTRDPRRAQNKTRARQSDLTGGRSGSDSNASRRSRGG
jgi:hypothetical protein